MSQSVPSSGPSSGRTVQSMLGSLASPTQASSRISIDQINLPAQQPRRYFDREAAARLLESIQKHGILAPLVVRPAGESAYELVCGERRLRAAKEIGMATVPVVIRELNDKEATALRLIENLHRENLNPIEETEGILDLLSLELELAPHAVEMLLNQANNAKKRGIELNHNVMVQLRTAEEIVSGSSNINLDSFRVNRLPLLRMPPEILELVRAGELEYSKARVVAAVKDPGIRAAALDSAQQGASIQDLKSEIRSRKLDAIPSDEGTEARQQAKQMWKDLAKSAVWEDPKKRKRLEALLAQVQSLLD